MFLVCGLVVAASGEVSHVVLSLWERIPTVLMRVQRALFRVKVVRQRGRS